jgi:hypothetical protein
MVGECLRNNTTLMLSLYLSLFLYSFALLQLGRGGATKLGLLVTVVPPFQRWSPSLLKTPASCRAQRVLSRSPCKSPTAFPIPPPIKSYNSERERSRKRRRKTKNKRRCVSVCVWVFFSLATILLLGAETTVGGSSSPFSYKMGFSPSNAKVLTMPPPPPTCSRPLFLPTI